MMLFNTSIILSESVISTFSKKNSSSLKAKSFRIVSRFFLLSLFLKYRQQLATSCPIFTADKQKFVPINPAPPVIIVFINLVTFYIKIEINLVIVLIEDW